MNQDCPGPQDLESFIRRRLDDTQARRIEDHLSSCRSCRQRLEELSAEETLAGRLREALGRPDVRDVLEQLRAQVEGRYEILSLIGQGSCGAVFEARDLRLQKRVAIKCPLKSAQKQRLAEAFREARILARIHHPHVAQIYHLEDHPDRPFMVMEYVDGIAITEATGHLPWRQRLEPFRCCLDALAQMHREGIVHRDLKPQNILVDRQGHTKLVDLGIAEQQDRLLDEGILPAPVQGTPAYMAPEQIQGLPAGCGMDVFAMGVVLYELLTDQRPFGGASVAEVCRAIQSRDPILPRTLRAQIPGPLQAICLAALEKDPADRYPSAREFLLDLERFFQGEPVVANPPMLRAILAHGVDRHIQDLARWRQDRIISGREYDCLADRYDRLRQREEFWVLDSRRITGSQVLLHLGGWLCVLSTFLLLCPGLGWERLPRTARIALPVALFAVLLVLGQRLWRRRNRRIAMVMLIAAALIFPFAIANGLITMEWLAGARQAGGEYFSIGQSA
ncbi:MAG: DUF2157 domain-containing protein, partial [Sedimentisphaerales bacterium]|nr:DUF2157 domain-containing protein [Sedimentisphaerales bacterium]